MCLRFDASRQYLNCQLQRHRRPESNTISKSDFGAKICRAGRIILKLRVCVNFEKKKKKIRI
jgi:hypothetical protein